MTETKEEAQRCNPKEEDTPGQQNQQDDLFSLCKMPLDISIGLTFDSEIDARECYHSYARREGFIIRKNHTQRGKDDNTLLSVDFCCNREGRRPDCSRKNHVARSGRQRTETRIGCLAMMRVKFTEGGKWQVVKFVKEHNHDLVAVWSDGTKSIHGKRVVTKSQKVLIDSLNEIGLSASKIAVALKMKKVDESVQISDFPNDVKTNKRRKLVKAGDAQRMQSFFLERTKIDPDFVYAFEMDSEGQTGNCFWVDGRSIKAYKYFGDAVTLDASFLKSSYGMPFVPFVGINHHMQPVMFGCALFVSKTPESYVWLLKTWLAAMGGQGPKTILTDQDKAMSKALNVLLPDTKHLLCMWYTLQKVSEQLVGVFRTFACFKDAFDQCINQASSVPNFERAWKNLTCKYGLEQNSWLQELYDTREKWVPAYVRQTFCAGMSTTKCSDSMDKLFRGYVKPTSTIGDFIYQYDNALRAQSEKEKAKDAKTSSFKPVKRTRYKIEEVASEVYTKKVFDEFQKELFESQACDVKKVDEDGDNKRLYKVSLNGSEDNCQYVALDRSSKVGECDCHMAEFMGLLCRHILAVFVKKSIVVEFPERYILSRWTVCEREDYCEAVNRALLRIELGTVSAVKRNCMYSMYAKITHLAEQSDEIYRQWMQTLSDSLLRYESMLKESSNATGFEFEVSDEKQQ